MKKFSIATAAMLLATVSAHAENYDRVVAFGDSLTDPGNAFVLTGAQSLAPYDPVPSFPYAIGSHHYSNGPTWVEQLTRELNLPLSGKPAFRNGRRFSNYAVGGATAGSHGTIGLSLQVSQFIADNAGQPMDDTLIAIWIGSNDIRAALLAYGQYGEEAASAVIEEALLSTAQNLQALYGAGGRDFLVLNLPNLGITPAIRSLGPDAVSGAAFFSHSYNVALDDLLATFETYLPGVSVTQLDIWSLLNEVHASPESFGLANSQSPCLNFGTLAHAVCSDPDDYLFWDALHATEAAHGIIATEAKALIVD